MRPERTPRTLRQIEDACSFVLSVTEGKSLADYSADRLLRQAVERNLQIMGEAVGRLRRDDPETAGRLSEHERIVGFRNVLVHGYDLVDDGIVWDTIRTKLPLLLSEVEALLVERESRAPERSGWRSTSRVSSDDPRRRPSPGDLPLKQLVKKTFYRDELQASTAGSGPADIG